MAKLNLKNKYVKYVLYGVPIAIGIYILYNLTKKKKGALTPSTPTTPPTPTKPTTPPASPTSTPPKQPSIGGFVAESGLSFNYGEQGTTIKDIQDKLNTFSYITPKLDADGQFGQLTFNAVWTFQQKNPPLDVDGIVGKNTWKALFGKDYPNK